MDQIVDVRRLKFALNFISLIQAVLHLLLQLIETPGLPCIYLLVGSLHLAWPKLKNRCLRSNTFRRCFVHPISYVIIVDSLRLLCGFLDALMGSDRTLIGAGCERFASIINNHFDLVSEYVPKAAFCINII